MYLLVYSQVNLLCTNKDYYNAILLSFSLNINLAPKVKDNCDLFNSNPLWKHVSDNNIQEYTYTFESV